MRSAVLLVALVAACRKPDPEWARAPPGSAGEPTIAGEPARLPRITRPIFDGKLDDAAWSSAAVLAPFVEPGTGRDPGAHPVAAFARAGWDDAALYLGLVVRDRAPASPFARDDRDPHVWSKASGIELVVQPGDPGDNRDYYELQVDVAGAIFDSHFDDYNAPAAGAGDARTFGHQEWASQVERAIFVQPGSFYAVELALPWASLAPGRTPIPPRTGDVWRLNLYTFRDGQRQALAWSPIRGRGNFHRSSQWGRVRFGE